LTIVQTPAATWIGVSPRLLPREGDPVADCPDGPVLRPSCHRIDCRGFGPAVTAAFCTVQMAMQRGAIDHFRLFV